MAGVLVQIPGGDVKFVPVAPELLLCCLSEVACRLRCSLREAFGFKSDEASEDRSCSPESEEEVAESGDEEDFRILFQGRDLENEKAAAAFLKVLTSGQPCMVRVLFRLLGGKGGFGSLLKNQKGGKKTTNFDAMRDLNGRRVRHVKAVERIKQWLEHKKTEDELVQALTGEGPELPAPTPESESLDEAFLEKLKKAAATRPAVVSEGFRRMLAEEAGEEVATKRLRTAGPEPSSAAAAASTDDDGDSVDWLGALASLGELSPDGEDEAASSSSAPGKAVSSSSSSSSAGPSKEVVKPKSSAAGTGNSSSPKAAAPKAAAAAPEAPKKAPAPAPPKAPPKAPAPAPPAAAPEKVVLVKPQDLAKYKSAEELAEKVSAESLKQSLQQLGLKCGGRPEERAKRLFALKDKSLKDLPKSFFAAPSKDS
mmetsp:Transcript_84463/g.149460  ORF Transcript_84463/g.149460 Transcript_84463/m.149460 type:complete len:425 (+) Transcript_84463:1-1275(+)